jgi:hypothetical protein
MANPLKGQTAAALADLDTSVALNENVAGACNARGVVLKSREELIAPWRISARHWNCKPAMSSTRPHRRSPRTGLSCSRVAIPAAPLATENNAFESAFEPPRYPSVNGAAV